MAHNIDIETLKEFFAAGYDYRSSLTPEIIEDYGVDSCRNFEQCLDDYKKELQPKEAIAPINIQEQPQTDPEFQKVIEDLCDEIGEYKNQSQEQPKQEANQINEIPSDAYNLEVFSIKNSEVDGLRAYIGFKVPNGNFHFVHVPYTEPKQEAISMAQELISWLDQECPQGSMTYDLSHDFAENLRDRLDNIIKIDTEKINRIIPKEDQDYFKK